MLPYREYIEILCVGLLQYYKTFKHITDDDFHKEERIIMQFANEMIDELNTRFPYSKGSIHSIGLFEIPYEVISTEIDDLQGVAFGTEYIQLLVKFISMMNWKVPNAYTILSINVVPFDGLTITHGMIIHYFDIFYK